jgi:hypothetical protein
MLLGDTARCRAEDHHLELREVRRDGKQGKRLKVPADALQVFTHEGQPLNVRITREAIGLEFWRSVVLIDRKTGKVKSRLTVADWPMTRPAPSGVAEHTMVGPGVADLWPDRKEPVVVARASFDGRTWTALQPANFLKNLMLRTELRERNEKYGAWTPILRRLHDESTLEASGKPGVPSRRFTVKDGLASNIVTHLAVFDGTLWASCVDIYDPEKKAWGPGGLCRYDDRRGRWQRVEVDGRPVRWATLLQVAGDELWVGYREGEGVVGDRVAYGKGVYADHYRPRVTAVVLARLKGGKWTRFSRPPHLDETGRRRDGRDVTKDPSTEVPRRLVRAGGNQVLLFSTVATNHASGNWNAPLDGALSLLETTPLSPLSPAGRGEKGTLAAVRPGEGSRRRPRGRHGGG